MGTTQEQTTDIRELRQRKLNAARDRSAFILIAVALAIFALTLSGCQSTRDHPLVVREGQTKSENFRSRVGVNLLEARALVLEQPAERAIALLEDSAFNFAVNSANLKYLSREPADPRVRSYLAGRFRRINTPPRPARVQIEPLTDRLFRRTVPATRPGQSYTEISPQQP